MHLSIGTASDDGPLLGQGEVGQVINKVTIVGLSHETQFCRNHCIQTLIRESQEIERQRRRVSVRDQTETRRKSPLVVTDPPKPLARVAASDCC